MAKNKILFFALILFSMAALIVASLDSVRQAAVAAVAARRAISPEFWNHWILTRALLAVVFLWSVFIFAQCAQNSKIIQKLQNPKIPFLFYFFVLCIYHFFMPFVGDDVVFKDVLNHQSLWQWTISRYETWSGRIVQEALVAIFPRIPYFIFKTLNILVFCGIFYYLKYFLNPENKIEKNYLLVLLLLIFPFYQLNSAGWMATMINYAWPLFGVLSVFYLHSLFYKNQKIAFYHYFFSFLGLCLAAFQEQSSFILILFSSALILKDFYCKNFTLQKNAFLLFVFFFALAAAAIVLLCPGNHTRYLVSVGSYPAFANFNWAQKIWLAAVPAMGVFWTEKLLFALLTLVLFWQNNKKVKILAAFFLAFSIVFGFFNGLFSTFFAPFRQFFNIFVEWNLTPTFSAPFIFSFIVAALQFAGILFLIYKILGFQFAVFFSILLASRFLMGTSPTVYVSVERTAIFAYFGIIVAIFFLFQKIKIQKMHFCVLAALAFLNILFSFDRVNSSTIVNFNWMDVELILLFYCMIFVFKKICR